MTAGGWPAVAIPEVVGKLAARLNHVRQQVATACARVGRESREVTLLAVTKSSTLDQRRAAYELGLRALGESRPQQLAARALESPRDIVWHMIGHLQRNKVEQVLPVAALVHSVDSVRLAERISQVAVQSGCVCQALLEVNVSGEGQKDGVPMAEADAAWQAVRRLPGLEWRGLMTMAPLEVDAERTRLVFRQLRQLRDRWREEHPSLAELSMGMSGDYAVAVEEGSTLVRLGSTLFSDETLTA